VSWLAGPPFK